MTVYLHGFGDTFMTPWKGRDSTSLKEKSENFFNTWKHLRTLLKFSLAY